MKHSIEWHINCLNNQKHYRDKLLREIDGLRGKLERTNREIFIYEQQILRAEEMGKSEFDEEKFNKKRSEAQ